jgi:hypothetical protein
MITDLDWSERGLIEGWIIPIILSQPFEGEQTKICVVQITKSEQW